MIRKIRKKTAQVTKSVKRFAANDKLHLSGLDSSFRDFWGRLTHKGRVELIATIVAGLLVGLIFVLAMLR